LEDVETDLDFCGLIVLENKLKVESTPCIMELKSIEIEIIMATGDAALTGISVAAECGIIVEYLEMYIAELIDKTVTWTHYNSDIEELGSYPGEVPWVSLINKEASKEFTLVLIGPAF
jgi:magnesium-transporting ATPase (P-type)